MIIQKIFGWNKYMSKVIVRIGERKKTITINNNSKVAVDKKEYLYELTHLNNSTYLLKVKDHFFKINFLENKEEKYILSVNGKKFISSSKSPLQERAEELIAKQNSDNVTKVLKAPMPGMVLEVNIKEGDQVNEGDDLLTLEAMKMENSIKSPLSGIVKEIFIKKNSPVQKDAKLLSIE